MNLSLRTRILLTLWPLLALLGVLGGAGIVLLYRLGGSIDLILKENYASVVAMERLNEALERIDSSFQFALAGEAAKASAQYAESWKGYDAALDTEEHNITLRGEAELAAELARLSEVYRKQGSEFYARSPGRRHALYFGKPGQPGLLDQFKRIKGVSGEIRRINQDNMVQASRKSQALANRSMVWFAVGLGVAVVLAILMAIHTTNALLRPIRAVTQSALAIGAGNLDQVVPVTSRDDLGQLAEAFNVMARQLRHYRQTDYGRLLRAQRTNQATIDAFPDPILVVDELGRVEMANPAAQRLFGVMSKSDGAMQIPWQPPEALQRPFEQALREQRAYLPEGFDRAIMLAKGTEEHFFLPRLLPIRDPYGNSLGAAILLQNVTRFRLLDQMKSNLVATASHELKTPLTSLRLAVHLLLEEAEGVGSLTPKQVELLVDARDNTERLLAVVNRLLDLTRLEQGREHLEIRPESPRELLRSAAEVVTPRASDKQITVTVDAAEGLPLVAADAGRLAHALGNLLDNALTYTDRGGRITLTATTADDQVALTVGDTGAGIPPEYLPHVFDRFFRVPGHSPEGGTGLGLAITREIIVAQGGSITCQSQPGVGTTFRIELPTWKDGQAAASHFPTTDMAMTG
ncbi:MAG TPA: ATP-binding protein [Gemmataceae bacterium]|nr:ATP-binding protein [Gemmataceae bacterium]